MLTYPICFIYGVYTLAQHVFFHFKSLALGFSLVTKTMERASSPTLISAADGTGTDNEVIPSSDSEQPPSEKPDITTAVIPSQQEQDEPRAAPTRPHLHFWAKQGGCVLGCLLLLVFAILIVNIDTGLAWKWHQTILKSLRPTLLVFQLTLIGILLALMDLVSAPVHETALLLFEAHFGRQLHQNYLAIMTGGIFTGTKRWMGIMVLTKLLPIVLSIGYKQFLGGYASGTWQPDIPNNGTVRKYGIDFPRVGAWSPPNDSIYLLLTAIAPFQTASIMGTAPYPSDASFPLVYGYNTILLGNGSAAVLDLPSGAYMTALQGQLGEREYVEVTADVDACIATLNSSSSSFTTDDALWNSAVLNSDRNIGFSTIYLYKGGPGRESLGMLPLPVQNGLGTFMALYYNSTVPMKMTYFWDPSDNRTQTEIAAFRARAQLYNIRRGPRQARWQLNATSILLLSGTCDPSAPPADSAILRVTLNQPFDYDILPPLVHTFEHLIVDANNGEKDNPWLQATYSVAVAIMYWARAQYIIPRVLEGVKFDPYQPRNESLVLVKEALNPSPWLYVVLSVQPAVALVALGFVVWVVLVKGLPSGDKSPLGEGQERELVRQHLSDELGTSTEK